MKNIATVFSLLVGLSSFAQSGKITLEGYVQNKSVSVISITDFNYREIASAELDINGNFRLTTKLKSDGYYLLTYGRNTAYVYLYPKDNIVINFDATYFESSLSFKGRGSKRNNYLAKKSIVGTQLTEDLQAFYQEDEAKYLENVRNVESTHQASLATYEVEEFFRKEELKSLNYQSLLSIRNYESSYKFFIGDEISASVDFYQPLKGLDLNNEADYRKHPYYFYLVNAIWNKRIQDAKDANGMLKIFRMVRSQPVAITLVNGFYSKISSSDNDRAKDYLDLIKMITTHQPFIEAAEKRYEEILNAQGLKKGDVSPEFSYESINGDQISLSDLQGKYVYIDVWATWCAPCIKHVPYLKQLEENYRGKKVVFVSISVDKEELKPRWKQMIADKELGGLQLFADNSFDSDFMNAFAVVSFPKTRTV